MENYTCTGDAMRVSEAVNVSHIAVKSRTFGGVLSSSDLNKEKSVDMTKIQAAKRTVYKIPFPPGNMGLELEPVIVSTQNQIGCRIKDYFIDTDHIGIDKEYLMNNVHVGDIIYDINGEKVHTYKFLDILNLLKCLKDTERIIGFKNLTYNTPTNSATNTPSKSTNKVDVSNIVLNNSVSPKSVPSTNNSPRFIKQGSNIKRKKIVKSNENSPVITAAQSDSKTTVLDAVSNTIEAAAENVLVTVVPRFSLLEMNEVINSKNELLNELSKTTVLLGISEEKYKTLEKHNIELQQAYADMMEWRKKDEDNHNTAMRKLQNEITKIQTESKIAATTSCSSEQKQQNEHLRRVEMEHSALKSEYDYFSKSKSIEILELIQEKDNYKLLLNKKEECIKQTSELNNQLREQLSAIRLSTSSFEASNTRLKESMHQSNVRVSQLETDLAKEMEMVTMLSDDRDQLLLQLTSLKRELQEEKNANIALAKDSTNADLTIELARLNEVKQSLEEQLVQATAVAESNARDIEAYKNQVASLTSDIASKSDIIQSLQDRVSGLQSEISNYNDQKVELKKQLSKQHHEIKSLTSALGRCNDEIDKLQTYILEKDNEIPALIVRATEAERQLLDKVTENDSLQAAIESHKESGIESLQLLSTKDQEIADLTEKLREKDELITQSSAYESGYNYLKSKNESIEVEIAQLKCSLDEKAQSLHALSNEKIELGIIISELQQSLDTATKEMEEKCSELLSGDQAYAVLTVNHNKAQECMQVLKEELLSLYTAHDQLSLQFKEMQQKYSDIDGEHTLLMIEVENRHYMELQQKQTTITTLQDSIQALKNVVGVCALQTKSLKEELNHVRQHTNELVAQHRISMHGLQDSVRLLGSRVLSLSNKNKDLRGIHDNNVGKLSDLEQRYADLLSKAVETERNFINLNRINAEKDQRIAEMSHKCGSYDAEIHKLQTDLSAILVKQKDKTKQLTVEHSNKLEEVESFWSKKLQGIYEEKEIFLQELQSQHKKEIIEIHANYKVISDENEAHKSAVAALEAQLINVMNENTNLQLNFNDAIESSANYKLKILEKEVLSKQLEDEIHKLTPAAAVDDVNAISSSTYEQRIKDLTNELSFTQASLSAMKIECNKSQSAYIDAVTELTYLRKSDEEYRRSNEHARQELMKVIHENQASLNRANTLINDLKKENLNYKEIIGDIQNLERSSSHALRKTDSEVAELKELTTSYYDRIQVLEANNAVLANELQALKSQSEMTSSNHSSERAAHRSYKVQVEELLDIIKTQKMVLAEASKREEEGVHARNELNKFITEMNSNFEEMMTHLKANLLVNHEKVAVAEQKMIEMSQSFALRNIKVLNDDTVVIKGDVSGQPSDSYPTDWFEDLGLTIHKLHELISTYDSHYCGNSDTFRNVFPHRQLKPLQAIVQEFTAILRHLQDHVVKKPIIISSTPSKVTRCVYVSENNPRPANLHIERSPDPVARYLDHDVSIDGYKTSTFISIASSTCVVPQRSKYKIIKKYK